MKRQILIYDIETFENLFTVTFYIRKTREFKYFVIHQSNNQYEELLEFLFSKPWMMVGFNNEAFDYPVIHHMINHRNEYSDLDGEKLAKKIYDKAQRIINEDFVTVWDNNKFIPQIDLYKIFHLDNKAKRTSLKDIEIVLNLPLVEDMPFDHHAWIFKDQIKDVLSYNKNDVYATWQFFELTLGNTDHPVYKGKNKIELRQKLISTYGLPCMNYNDVKIGVELIVKMYCDKFGISPKEIKRSGGTPRPVIHLKDCIPHWVNFKSKELNKVVKFFENVTVYDGALKDTFSFSQVYHGIRIDYGSGGVHACIKPGIYESDDEYVILDFDIDSQYPMIGITLGIFPQHLGKEYLDIYGNGIVLKRVSEKKKPKDQRDFVVVEGFKLAANGATGKYNEATSPFYDPMCTLRTTIGGQMMISMWTELFCENIPDCTIIQMNTDGVTIRIPKKYAQKSKDLSNEFTKSVNMTYEVNEYTKMIVRDVNNYCAQYASSGNIKYKGDFEIDRELHKDPSMKIVRLALSDYFFKGIPVSQTITNHKNIYDFCMRLKTDSRFIPEYNYLDENGPQIKKLTRTTRYYIANHGGSLTKRKNHDGSGNTITSVNKGFIVQLFNKYEEKEDYDINYSFYIRECNKIIDSIESKQLSLF